MRIMRIHHEIERLTLLVTSLEELPAATVINVGIPAIAELLSIVLIVPFH